MRSTPKPCRDTNVLSSFVEISSTAVLPARTISRSSGGGSLSPWIRSVFMRSFDARDEPGAHNRGMPNRLASEQSPYLLQHKDNPVDWFPWGPEAFETSRGEDKPIFLSIGYSTCHWCHVMEHESFEHDAVAAVLNQHFVSIKVDREERPDVDRVYMTFVQATTGSGGWPMSVWLTPELKPFYGGTYFPPSSKYGRPGFVDILREIARVWKAERTKVLESAEVLTARLKSMEHAAAPVWTVPSGEALEKTVK